MLWYHTCFSPSWCCWVCSGSAACYIMRGPAGTPQTSRGSPSLSHHPASSPVPRSPFLASSTSPIATRVSTPPRLALRPPAPRHPPSSPRADAAARWTLRAIAVPLPTVAMAAGSGWAILGPACAFEQKGTVLNGRCSPRRVARLMVCRLGAADVETAGNGRV